MAIISWEHDGRKHESAVHRPLRVGREGLVDICVPDRSISKEHAVFEPRADGVWIIDLGSTNGTYVNRRRVVEPRRLEDGDQVLIGRTAFIVDTQRAPKPTTNVRIRAITDESAHARSEPVPREDRRFLPHGQFGTRRDLANAYERLRIAWEVQNAVIGETDPERVFDRLLDAALWLFEADRAVVMTVTPDGGLETAAFKARNGESSNEFEVSRTVVQRVMDEGAAVLSVDARTDTRFRDSQSLMAAGVRATMAVPLVDETQADGVVHGVVYLDSTMAVGAFAEKDITLLADFARAATRALALHHAAVARERELVVRRQLARLMPEPLVAGIMRGDVALERGGRVCQATVLFADIRGFTTLSEKLPATEVVALLNSYFDVMVDVVFAHGGVLDKFIGDAVMAVWGGAVSDPEHATRAALAAVEMQEAIRDFNATRALDGLPAIAVGVGLGTGELVAGYIGSARAMSHTVIGDVVNTAARACSVAGPGEVIATADVVVASSERVAWEPLPPMTLKGKAQTVALARAIGLR